MTMQGWDAVRLRRHVRTAVLRYDQMIRDHHPDTNIARELVRARDDAVLLYEEMGGKDLYGPEEKQS